MVPSACVRVIREVTAVMYIFSFPQHLQFSPAFRRKLCFSVLCSLKQPGKGSSSRCKLQWKLILRAVCWQRGSKSSHSQERKMFVMHFKKLSSEFQKRPGLSWDHWEHALHASAQVDNMERGQATGVLGRRDEGSTPHLPKPRDEPVEGAVTPRTLSCRWVRGHRGAGQRVQHQAQPSPCRRCGAESSPLPHALVLTLLRRFRGGGSRCRN